MAAHNFSFSEVFEKEKDCEDDPFIFDKSQSKKREEYQDIVLEGCLLSKDLTSSYYILQEYKLTKFIVSYLASKHLQQSDSSLEDEGTLHLINSRLVKGRFRAENK